MPYDFKGKKDCTQKNGNKGKYLTIKKNGSRKCYKSKEQYDAAMAWAHESDDKADEKTDKFISLLEENLLRRWISFIISSGEKP
tara:strand:- start:577 stop:828 length:252 start_codon:yes stop_codon:yes gene_type:complete